MAAGALVVVAIIMAIALPLYFNRKALKQAIIADIGNVFDKGEVAYIYLNFSDPWPKDRHAKRRLTSRQFLKRYEEILPDGGGITFKTDNVPLFNFSLEEVEAAEWKLLNFTRDLHKSEYNEGNVMTEYEKKFSELGNPICRLVAQKKVTRLVQDAEMKKIIKK